MLSWLLGGIGLLLVLFLWMAAGIQVPGEEDGKIIGNSSASSNRRRPTLKAMTWNIAYGFGLGSAGVNYTPKTKQEYQANLDRMAETIRSHSIDLVLLQEVDFDADRSHRVDQLAYLKEKTGLPYAAYATSWKANYVPYPYWPPSHHFGKVRSGGGILSRYPIKTNRVQLHAKPAANPWWYNSLYLFRFSQHVEIEVAPDQRVSVVNNHLEAFATKNRESQSQRLVEWIEKMADRPILIGGDLNTVPREATKKSNFTDDARDDYEVDFTLPNIAKLEGYREIIERDEYLSAESKYFTFPAGNPNRRLDYLFYDRKLKLKRSQIIQTGELSDHLPVTAEFEWLD